MKKQPEKTAQTKAALTSAFWQLYKKQRIENITVKEITDRAGFYRSTFYLYFTDVYDLLGQLENEILEAWEDTMTQVVSHGKIETFLDMFTAFYEERGEYLSVLLSPDGDPTFLPKIKNTLRRKMFSVLQVSDDDEQAILCFEFSSSAVLAFLTSWYRRGKQIPAREAVALVRSLMSEGSGPVMIRHAVNPPDTLADLFQVGRSGSL